MAEICAAGVGLHRLSLVIGMAGYHYFEGMPWIDAFVNSAMLMGGMGPVSELHTDAGKLFAGLYALYCGLVVIIAIGIVAAPLLHRILHHFHLEASTIRMRRAIRKVRERKSISMKSTVDQIRQRFDNDVERFSNLETGQSATIDAPLVLDLITAVAAATNPDATHVLDIGCGAGNYTLKLLERLPDIDVTLIDLSKPMLDRALQRIGAVSDGNIMALQGDIRAIALPDRALRHHHGRRRVSSLARRCRMGSGVRQVLCGAQARRLVVDFRSDRAR